jgi:hypothetical protein
MLARMCRGVVSARAWYRSPTTFPLRPRARFTASANRMARPCTPPRARRASSPSTMKCPWSCWIEKWITRKRSTDARAMAPRTAPNTRADRSDGSPGVARIVTCTGHPGFILGRVTWGIEGRLRGFSPAPLRAPPQVLAAASGSRSCRLRPALIARMFRCRHRRRRVAWRVHLIARMFLARGRPLEHAGRDWVSVHSGVRVPRTGDVTS